MRDKRVLYLEDGSCFEGYGFGSEGDCEGEVVFSTGMVGYTEGLTDPSYLGQVLVLTYPLIGNYGVADITNKNVAFGATRFESGRIKVRGLVVSSYIDEYSHWSADFSLDTWLKSNKVPGIFGIDTRHLAIKLREKGVLLGYIAGAKRKSFMVPDPNRDNLVAQTSTREVIKHGTGRTKILLVDCGVKRGIIEDLIRRKTTVYQVPWNYKPLSSGFTFDGVVVSNGPGDPKMVGETIKTVSELMNRRVPILGICLGNQVLALASGADTYKLKFGHRSHNQPVIACGTKRCYLTTQNHGFAVNTTTLKNGWSEWFRNLNDDTCEGIKHNTLPFMSVQFHPEGRPGPDDTNWVFDYFLERVKIK